MGALITEAGFAQLIDALRAGGYRFAGYGEAGADKHVIWRHDIDLSVHRAARLAEIERARGVRAIYFVNPRSPFYNIFEPETAAKLGAIGAAGHEIGLHFDGAAPDGGWSADTLKTAVIQEGGILEAALGRAPGALSWHNPDQSNLLAFDAETIGGLHNAYSARMRADYLYGSDSNGYWRFKPMAEIIAADAPRLHLLTHPGWWTPEALSPAQRVDRAILGRARAVRRDYDAQLLRAGRKNIDE